MVPPDWGDRELVWTITHNGETVNGSIVRNAKVGEEAIFLNHVADDGLLKPRDITTETNVQSA